MRFRKVIARWDNASGKGVIKYQLGEIIVTVDNESSLINYDAHFLIPGVVDRVVSFKSLSSRPLYLTADTDVSEILLSRIETWYPLEALLAEENVSDKIRGEIEEEEFTKLMIRKEELREQWKQKMFLYKTIAKAWNSESKENTVPFFTMEIKETPRGILLLAKQRIGDNTFKTKLYSFQEEQEVSKEIELENDVTFDEAVEWHFRNAKIDKKEKRHWETYVHTLLPNYEQLIEEQLKGE